MFHVEPSTLRVIALEVASPGGAQLFHVEHELRTAAAWPAARPGAG